ncbi:hypothetical protein ABEB36_007195 [Hypothenemus hampei]|uniref:Peptidase S1 domain-containing protein n=1 Tax=Hypothenemus hampei TaxID=57062 RepID=A0ABD1ET60_HYPHA
MLIVLIVKLLIGTSNRKLHDEVKFISDRKVLGVDSRIIGGDIATPHQYPYQVALYIWKQVTQYFCGGVLISLRWVLTAAHCVDYATEILVYLGTHDLTQSETGSRVIYNTSTYIIHENYDSVLFQNDVALIRLPEEVALNQYIATIPISQGNQTYVGEMSTTLGWGLTATEGYSTVLRYVDTEVISNAECAASHPDYAALVVDQHLCTTGKSNVYFKMRHIFYLNVILGEGIVGSCSSDSGGAVVINEVLVGVVSWGAIDCTAGLPSVNARLTFFYDWIQENSGKDVMKISPHLWFLLLSIFFVVV